MSQLAGDHVQVLVGGYNLTADSHRISLMDSRGMLESTSFGDAVQNFQPGQRKVSLEHLGYLNAAASGAHTPLKTATLDNTPVSVLLGQNANPAVGDPVYSFVALQGKYQSLPQVGKIIPFTAQFGGKGVQGGWGQALTIAQSFSTTGVGTAVGGTASNNGGVVFYHILQGADQTCTLSLQGADNSAFTLNVVTLAGTSVVWNSGIGGAYALFPPAVPAFIRLSCTRTAGTPIVVTASLVRF